MVVSYYRIQISPHGTYLIVCLVVPSKRKTGFRQYNRGIVFCCYNLTSNKNDRLLIEINLLDNPLTSNSFDEWNNVVETSISITSDSLALTTLPDGDRYPFGLFPISNGAYRLRVYCRGLEQDPYEKSKEESIESYENVNNYPWAWGMDIKIYIWAGELLEQRTLHQTG